GSGYRPMGARYGAGRARRRLARDARICQRGRGHARVEVFAATGRRGFVESLPRVGFRTARSRTASGPARNAKRLICVESEFGATGNDLLLKPVPAEALARNRMAGQPLIPQGLSVQYSAQCGRGGYGVAVKLVVRTEDHPLAHPDQIRPGIP